MGVDNLLNFIKNATKQTNITEAQLPNSTAAVDISHWIYKASYACPEAMYHRNNMNQVYTTIINYIHNYVRMLRQHNVKLTFVFDGLKVPAKKVTHDERASRKAEARRMVEKYLAEGNQQEARKQMFRCVEVKFDIVQQIIAYCKREHIDYIVSPYEADAQLAFLNLNNICDFVITEDTDLILYGCRKIIYKLDLNGACVLFEISKLSSCLGTREEIDFQKFRRICIMSGCDYLKNIPTIGLQKAKRFFLMTKQDNLDTLLPKISTYLKAPSLKGKITQHYIDGFIKAELTFKHHIVYDPVHSKLRPLEPYPKGKSSSDFPMAGKRFHSTLAKEIVRGNIDLDKLDYARDLDSASDASDLDNPDSDECEEIATMNGGLPQIASELAGVESS